MDLFKLGQSQDGSKERVKGVRNDPLGFVWYVRFSQGLECEDPAPFFAVAGHQIEDCINQTPGKIAADCRDDHFLDISAVYRSNTVRTSNRKDHN